MRRKKNTSSEEWHKHRFVLPVTVFFMLFFAGCAGLVLTNGQTIGAADSKVVRLYVDGQTRTVPTRATTVREVLHRSGVELHRQDVVEPELASPVRGENFSINVYRARPVTIIDNAGQKTVARVAPKDPASAAKAAGLAVYPEDKLSVASPRETLSDGVVGDKIVLDRALPIKLSLYGTVYDIRTQATTVADLARERDIRYDQTSILPRPETALKADDVVFVAEVGKQISVIEEAIPQTVTYSDSADMEVGTQKVKEPGSPGKKAVVYELAANGSKKALQEVVVTQPTAKLVTRGVKPKANSFAGGFDAALARLRSCEGSYASNTGNGYYGAYQFNVGSWRTNAPADYANVLPSDAPPSVQDITAATYYKKSGWRPWPACSAKLGLQDIYR